MTSTLCPYCNATLPAIPAVPADRLPCPRCGEGVPPERWPIDPNAAAPASPPRTAPAGAPGIRATALAVLGIMLVMALLGGSYALWTTQLRQSRHPWMPKVEAPIAQRRPLELAGLGYLPKGSQFVAGLHIGEMMADKENGAPLLDEPRPAWLDWLLRQVQRTTGMTPADLDHVIVAAALDENFPQLVLVVRTRTPADLSQVAKIARPSKTALYKDRPLYEFSLNPIGEAYVWCVEDRTLVYVLRQDEPKLQHLNGLSATPRSVKDVLPAPLHRVLEERLRTHQFVWAVGQVDQLGPLRAFLPRELGAVKEMRTVAVGIRPDEGLALTANVQVADVKSAGTFKSYLEGVKVEGATSQKIEVTAEDAPEHWLTWQVRGDAATFRAWLDRDKERKK